MDFNLKSLKKDIPHIKFRTSEMKVLLEEEGLTEDDIKQFFEIDKIPYDSILFMVAMETILIYKEKFLRKVNKYIMNDVAVVNESIVVFDEMLNHAVRLVNSNNPPESIGELSKLTGLSKLKIAMYLKKNQFLQEWYRSIVQLKGLVAFENVSEGAEYERPNNADGKEGHKWKANSLLLGVSKNDFLKNNFIENPEKNINNFLNIFTGEKKNISNEKNIIDITNSHLIEEIK